jgi:hypothetical protein
VRAILIGATFGVNMKTLEQVYEKFSSTEGGGDKGNLHSYLPVYKREMKKRSGVSLLEVGVWQGHSIAMWNAYLTKSTVIGLDVNVSRCLFDVDARECDATNPEQIVAALGDLTFDYIIDDGSHQPGHQIRSFELLWDRVKPGGKYFVEDIESDEALVLLGETVARMGVEFTVYDLRHEKGRYDDIMLVARRE